MNYTKVSRLIFPVFIVLFSFFKLYRLDGGLVLGDPDEWTHWEVAESFGEGIYPSFSGGAWYYSLPLFPFLGHLAGWGGLDLKFVSLRIVSVLFSTILALGIYYYLRWKVEAWAGFWAALLWCLTPFAVHYSRLGLLEVTVTSLCFLSFFIYDYALSISQYSPHRGSLWALMSGIMLGLAILTKYTALILVLFYGLVLLVVWLSRALREAKHVSKGGLDWGSVLKFRLVTLLPLAIGGLITGLVFLFYYRADPYQVKTHLLVNLVSWTKYTDAKLWIGENYFKLSEAGWWLGWPLVVLSLVGLIVVLLSKQRNRFSLLGVFGTLSILAVVLRQPFYPRYFVFLIPFFCLLGGVAVGWFMHKFRPGWLGGFGCLLLVVYLGFGFKLGVNSSYSIIMRDTNHQLPSTGYLFSNYWPHIVAGDNDYVCATWLASDNDQVHAFCPDEDRSSLEILAEEGGVVILERDYSRRYISAIPSRLEAAEEIHRTRKPDRILAEPGSNFPYFRKEGKEIEIYIISNNR